MKKFLAILVSLTLLLAFAACGAKKIQENVPPVTEAPTTNEPAALVPENMTGMYELVAENNEGVDFVGAFGSSYLQTGAQMLIGTDGHFDFDIGATGGAGKATANGNVVTAVYNDYNENEEHTLTLNWNNGLYTMNINGVDVVWSITRESDGDEATGEIASLEELNAILGSKLNHPGAMGVSDEKFAVEGEGEEKVAIYTFTLGAYTYNFRATKSATQDVIIGKTEDGDCEFPQTNEEIAYKKTPAEKAAWWLGEDMMSYGLVVKDAGAMDMEMFKGCAQELQEIVK